jgi:ABC-type bacteriocin/lantibiotic exporter with double-glycine peptidase domain
MLPKSYLNSTLKRLWQQISLRRQRQLKILVALMVLTSFTEVLSIGAVLPFLGVLTNPELIYESNIIKPLINALGIGTSDQLLIPLTIVFCIAAILSGAMRLLLLWCNAQLAFNVGADLSLDIYRKTLYQPYSVHISRNSSNIIDAIGSKTHQVIVTLNHVVTMLSSLILIVAITIALLWVNSTVALTAIVGFAFLYAVVVRLTHKRLLINSQRIAKNSTEVIKSLQEGLSGIRDVLIDRTQAVYCDIYSKADRPLKRAQAVNSFIGASPRYAMEALGITLIAILACGMAISTDGISSAIPILGALALGAQRLIPLVQNVYVGWAYIRGAQASLDDALNLLEQPLPDYATDNKAVDAISFNTKISLLNVSFRYSTSAPYVVKNLNLDIVKGSRIGFVGTTGSGKSTLLDIIMGMLTPDEGEIRVDSVLVDQTDPRSWQKRIAHVPQSIYLADATIAENIAFGLSLSEIDMLRVARAAELAQIAKAINEMPSGYHTIVGERGVRLSGGQRQRIGIARALFRKADVFIFDEATSALDSETEETVMEAIKSLSADLTILIIAHRETTVRDCSIVYRLNNGILVREK